MRARAGALVITMITGCLSEPGLEDLEACTRFGPWEQAAPLDLAGLPPGSDQSGATLSADALELWFTSRIATVNERTIRHAVRTRRTDAFVLDDHLVAFSDDVDEPFVAPDGLAMYVQVRHTTRDLQVATRPSTSDAFFAFRDVLAASGGDELSPTITADGRELLFAWSTDGPSGDSRRLYSARRDSTSADFLAPSSIIELSFVTGDFPAISPDGTTLFWTGGASGSEMLYSATRPNRDVPWTNITPFGAAGTLVRPTSPALSGDQTTLVFSAPRGGADPGRGLWITTRTCEAFD